MTRREHYRDFYDGAPVTERPLAAVYGNCQAEALRVLLAGSPGFSWQVVRMPPVHELVAEDLPALAALLARCTLLVSQPVQPGYRGLPLGTTEVAGLLAPGAQVVRWPVIRYSGLHPWQAIVRAADGAEPPLVPYHDLRTLTGASPVGVVPPGADVRASAEASRAELARREARDTDVAVSDLLLAAGADAVHTINHPGNSVLIGLARRVQEAVGALPEADEPGRVLLGGVRAPLETAVLAALGLPASSATEHWLVGGQPLAAEEVEAAHRDWYATRPDVVAAGLQRYAALLPVLGLAPTPVGPGVY